METYACDEKGAVEEKRTLTLISCDDQEFVISESAAFLSEMVKTAVAVDCASRVIPLPNVDSKTLAKVITYLNKHVEGVDSEKKSKFDEEFVSEKEINDLLCICRAAIYLDVKGLVDIVSKKMAEMCMNKSVRWIRKTFGIENDFTPEEEEMIRQENAWAG